MEKYKEKQGKINEAFNKMTKAMDKAVNEFVKQATNKSGVLNDNDRKKEKMNRAAINAVNKIFSKFGTIYVEMFKLHIKLCKGVLAYASLCVANYKPNV